MAIDEKIYISIKACPLCDSTDSQVIGTETNKFTWNDDETKEYFAVYERDKVLMRECQRCKFAYLDRLPKDANFFERLYSEVKYNYEYEFKYHGKKEIHKDIKRGINKYYASGTLLDIGAWCGTLLEAMADTYSTVGCELSEDAAAYGRSVGLNIQTGSFDEVGFSPESFDVITIIDVLEHLPQPKEMLKKIFSLLKKGGIVYIKVPNGKGQMKKQNLLQVLKLSRQGVGVNFVHINHFNQNSLRKVLINLGVEVLEMGYTKPEIWDLSFPDPINSKIKKWTDNQIRNLGTSMASFISYVSPADLGFNIYAIAKK